MKLKNYFTQAKKQGWAIGQFNFSSLEQLKAIFEAAKELKSPIILGTSEGESRYFGLQEARALVDIYKTNFKIPAFLNLDHGKDLAWIKKAIDLGYDAVHFDGSGLEIPGNIAKAKEIVKYGHKKGVLVEGELGAIQGESKLHYEEIKIQETNLTPVEEAENFVKKSGVDSLAVSIGNVHGVFTKMPVLDLARLQKIRENVKSYLVLHGGSGIPETEIKMAINNGISKINFNTELRLVWQRSLIKFLQEAQEPKPYKILPKVCQEIKKIVEGKIKMIGSVNKA